MISISAALFMVIPVSLLFAALFLLVYVHDFASRDNYTFDLPEPKSHPPMPRVKPPKSKEEKL